MPGLAGGCVHGSHAAARSTMKPHRSSSGSFRRSHEAKCSRGDHQQTPRAVRVASLWPVVPVERSDKDAWGCASPPCTSTTCGASSSSRHGQPQPSSRASRACIAHATAAAAESAGAGNTWTPKLQPAAEWLRSPATLGFVLRAAATAADSTPHPASSTSREVPSSSALPDDFWEERRKLLRSMRHERDPVNKRARFKAVRQAEQARLAQMTPQQQAAYEEEMRALRIAGIAAQRAALDTALATGLRVVVDCEYAVPKQGYWQPGGMQQTPDSTKAGHLAQAAGSTPQDMEADGSDGEAGSSSGSSSSSRREAAHQPPTGPNPQQQVKQPGQQPYPQLDVAWGDGGIHHDKEIRSLAKQIEASMSMNRRSSQPVALTVTSFCGPLASFANHIGASSWPVNKHAAPLLEVYPATDCIFLSPDADEPLLELDPQKVYVIGGIVDRSVRKGLTLGKAERHGLAAVRLPVLEYAKHLNLDGPSASNRPVLNVSDVVVALVEFARTGDWVHALRAAVPARKQRGGSDSSSQDEG